MIAATVAMVGAAVLFAVFGAWGLADTGRGCHGDCGACGSGACELDPDSDRRSS